jgi:hypothetical protein
VRVWNRGTVILLKLQSLAFVRITIAHRDSAKLNTNQKKVMFEVVMSLAESQNATMILVKAKSKP